MAAVVTICSKRAREDVGDDYEVVRDVGKGSYGFAFLCRLRRPPSPHCSSSSTKRVKVVDEHAQDLIVLKRPRSHMPGHALEHELRMHGQLPPHTNVLRLLHSDVLQQDRLVIYTEYADAGSLEDLLCSTRSTFELRMQLDLLAQMCRGLAHMHANGVSGASRPPAPCRRPF